MNLYSPESFLLKTLQWEIPENDKELLDYEVDYDLQLLNSRVLGIPCIFNLSVELFDHCIIRSTKYIETVRFDMRNNIFFLLEEQIQKLRLNGRLFNQQGFLLVKDDYLPEFIKVKPGYFDFKCPTPRVRNSNSRYSRVKASVYSRFQYNETYYNVLLTNLPYKYYKQAIPSKSCYLIYDFRSMRYTMGVNDEKSSSYLFDNFYNIAEEGIKFPVISFLLDKGNIFHLDSQKRTTLAKYLKIPSIPSFVIQTNFQDEDFVSPRNVKDLTEMANSILNPYFHIGRLE